MRFSKRIYALRDAVNIGETVADIGTDHGYVPMLLVRDKISPRVIMSDISADSLAKSIETFRTVCINASSEDFRVGDGLSTIASGETDTVIIAGLGGHTIIQILSEDIDKSRSFRRLILQPRKHSGALRAWLYQNSFDVEREILTSEGKFICEIIVAVPVSDNDRALPYPEDDIRWAYPETLRLTDADFLRKRVSWKLGSINEQIDSLARSEKDKNEIIDKLKADHDYLCRLIGEDEEA